jgi:hypothetical protein
VRNLRIEQKNSSEQNVIADEERDDQVVMSRHYSQELERRCARQRNCTFSHKIKTYEYDKTDVSVVAIKLTYNQQLNMGMVLNTSDIAAYRLFAR